MQNMIQYSHELAVSHVYAKVSIGASGACTLVAGNSLGVISCTKETTAGQYTLVFGYKEGSRNFLRPFAKLLAVDKIADVSGASGPPAVTAAPEMVVLANNSADATKASITLQLASDAGSAANPASGEVLYLHFTFGDSSV